MEALIGDIKVREIKISIGVVLILTQSSECVCVCVHVLGTLGGEGTLDP